MHLHTYTKRLRLHSDTSFAHMPLNIYLRELYAHSLRPRAELRKLHIHIGSYAPHSNSRHSSIHSHTWYLWAEYPCGRRQYACSTA